MGEERQLTSKVIYEGRILNLRVDEIETADKHRTIREVIEHKPAVAVLAVTDNDSVLLVSQFRYAVGADMLEICAGLVEEGESFRETAEREMQEELGYFPEELEEIGRFYVSPGYCEEMIALFAARKLRPSRLAHDDDEDLSTVEVPVADIPNLIQSGKIKDAKTWTALVWFMSTLKNRDTNAF